MNQQREVIYSQRRKVLTGDNLKENILENLFFVVELSRNSLVFLLTSSSPEFLRPTNIERISLYISSLFYT